MRVTYILSTADLSGGTEKTFIQQANYQARKNHVEIISVYRDRDKPSFQIDGRVKLRYIVDRRNKGNAQFESALIPREWDNQFSAHSDARIIKALRKINADIVVTSTPALTLLADKYVPERTILVAQEHRPTASRGITLTPLLDAGRRVDCLVSLVSRSDDWIKENLGSAFTRTAVIPNALEEKNYPIADPEVKRVVVAGRFVSTKAIDRLVGVFADATSADPEWRLRIYGGGPQISKVRSAISRHQVAARVELMTGFSDLRGEWAKGSISIMGSSYEGLPMVLLEAAHAGLPLVSFDTVEGPREVIEDGHNGFLVPVGNYSAMTEALRELVNDSTLRAKMGKASRAFVKEKFSPEVVGKQWDDLFEKLIATRAPGSTRLSRAVRHLTSKHTPGDSAEVLDSTTSGVRTCPSVDLPSLELREFVTQLEVPNRVTAWDLSTGIDPRYGPTLFVRTTEDLRHIVDQMRARFQLHFDLELHSPDGPICTVSMEDEDPHDWTLRAVSKIGFVDRQTTVEIAVVYVEVHPVAPGEFIPQNPNPWFSELRFDPHEEPYPAVVDTVAGLQSQPHWSSVNFPIDVVYTWVDGSDPVLARDRNEALGQDALTDRALDATSAARFTSRDELKYSLRSFEKFAPWVRKFYVVTDRQVPVWLRENDRIEIVDHRDLFPDVNVLPVFNSHSIETVLHRIEGLSEHFIYANDDVMLVSDVFPSDFFDQCGSVAVHFSNVKVNVGLTDQPHLVAAENNRSFLNSSGFGTLTNSLVHVPHSHRVSILQEIEQRYPDAIARTRSSKFRGPEDISLLSSFAQYYALSTGRGFEGKLKYTYLSLANSRLEKLLDKIESQRNAFNVFAIGDVAEPTAISQRNEAILFEYLENRFDQLSFAEK